MFTIFGRLAHSPYMPSARAWLIGALAILMMISLLMVASASIPYAMKIEIATLKFFWSQLGYMLMAVALGSCLYRLPLQHYYRLGALLCAWLVLLGLLLATLLFGQNINGSQRWLNIFGMSFQPAEVAKVLMVLMVTDYITRRSDEFRHGNTLINFLKIMVWYTPVMLLLYLQPDFGSIVVIGATLVVMFFVGGMPIKQQIALGAVIFVAGGVAMLTAGYRKERLLSFWDPFDDVLDTDYQLARSLSAFGRGEFNGVGYGNSIQKLEHLPEAHTDFLLAITGEELGFLGVFLVILLEFIILAAIMRISYNALHRYQLRLCYTAFGFGVVIFGQVLINAGMNMGLLPTKGLTMPFFSYGGSSMLLSILMIAIILKIDKESPIIAKQGESRNY